VEVRVLSSASAAKRVEARRSPRVTGYRCSKAPLRRLALVDAMRDPSSAQRCVVPVI
jgi:hypothetical protein